MSTVNVYAIASLDELEKENKRKLENAIAEIHALLNSKGGGPITKKKLKEQMSGDVKPYFENARQLMIVSGELYITPKGLVNEKYKLTVEDRVAHIKWCLKLHEVSSRQYLQDKPILLDVPSMLKKLKDRHGSDFPRWRKNVIEIQKQAKMMGSTLNELADAYIQIDAAIDKMLPKTTPKEVLGKSLSDLSSLKKKMKRAPNCKYCGSYSVRLIGKHKDTIKCNDCGRLS